MTEDFYELMEVDEDASQDEIKDAFREKVREYHPDLNDDPRAQAQFTALKKAYDTLGDASERNAYDRMGHEDYVAKRIKGLPSPDKWKTDSSSGGGSSGSASSATARQTGSSRSSSSSRTAGSSRSSGSASSSRSSGSRSDSRSRSSGNRSSGSRSSDGDERTDPRQPGGSSGSRSRSSSASTSSTSNRRTASTASAAGATSTGTGGSGGTRSSSRGTGGRSAGPTTAAAGDHGPLDRVLRVRIGWRGITFANLVYLAGVALFVYGNRASLFDLGEALATTEQATIRTALTSSPGTTFEAFLYDTALVPEAPVSVPAAVLVLGAVLLPLLYGVVVKRTRSRVQGAWSPTWLYVVCMLGPLAAVGANLAGYAYVGVDVAGFLLLPALSMLVLPLSAFVRPKILKLFA
jgi:curved DNA-binding protein CbpA